MAHYAKVVNNIVTQVIVAEADFFKIFVDSSPGAWIQTSYNTRGGIHYAPNSDKADNGVALRGNYAGIGYVYDQANDVFYPPKPYASWTIAAPDWTWKAPVPYPKDGNMYKWNESNKDWEQIK